jgi:hypothetical protein
MELGEPQTSYSKLCKFAGGRLFSLFDRADIGVCHVGAFAVPDICNCPMGHRLASEAT